MEKGLDELLNSYRGKAEELIPILQRIQAEFGYLPEEAILKVAEFLGIPEAHVYGVASFYDRFRLKPMGKNVCKICKSMACQMHGASRLIEEARKYLRIEEGDTAPDLNWTLETVECIGLCALAPCVVVNGHVVGRMTSEKLIRLLEAAERGES
jgi:NADH-quinone oxidoreductase subunit E